MSENDHLAENSDSRGESLQAEDTPDQSRPGGAGGRNTESRWLLIWESLSRAGLGETVFRLGTHVLSIALVLIVIWAMRAFYLRTQQDRLPAGSSKAAFAAPLPSATPTEILPELPDFGAVDVSFDGIARLAMLHTDLPTRPRTEIITYTVQTGDTIFGIGEKFNLNPKTILWGNYYTLLDSPDFLQIGQVLNILPENGTYHKWSDGEGLNGVAKYYGVTPDVIIGWEGNHLDPATVGDLGHPNIKAGTMLFVPGGHRAFVSWSAPRISRENPAVAKLLGPGSCGTVPDGAVGSGTFSWPAGNHFLSGYNYSPETNHNGIDIAGGLGAPIYAADSGVVVYAGWNNWGYGNVVVIDHARGWQTLYAHMSALNVGCGQSVDKGSTIGYFGSTGNSSGPHLHFEMLSESYGKVNPWNFLPAP